MPDTTNSTRLKRLVPLLLLIALGLVANMLAPRLFTGFNYLFGSIVSLVILRLYGIIPATVSALIAGAWCQVLFGHPTPMVWLGLEPIFVGLWLRRRPQGSLLLADAVYWASLGVPLIFILFRSTLDVPLLGTTTAALMYLLIGITNALIAGIITGQPGLRRLIGLPHETDVSLQRLLYHLLLAVILLPAILVLVLNGREREQHNIRLLVSSLEAGVGKTAFELRNHFFPDGFPDRITRQSLTAVQMQRLKQLLDEVKDARLLELTLLDAAGGVLASTDPFIAVRESYSPFGGNTQRIATERPDIWRRIPGNNPPVPLWQRAGRSAYLRIQYIPHTDLTLLFEAPFAPYQKMILTGHRNALAGLLLYLLAIFSLSSFAARSITRPLHQLSDITTDIPLKLRQKEALDWPHSTISDVTQLTANIRAMAAQLASQFTEIATANQTLEERVAERTRELSAANQTLQDEIMERTRVERQRDHLTDELVYQLRFLQTLLDAIPIPVYYKDKTGHYQGCNQAFAHALGQHRESIVGKTAEDLFPPESARIYRAADVALLASGGEQRYEAGITYCDGSQHTIIIHKALYKQPDGSTGGLIGAFADITDHKQAEEERDQLLTELEAKNKELEGIIYIASHDLRSPLVNIQGFSRRLSRHCDDLKGLLTELPGSGAAHGHLLQLLNEQIPKATGFIGSSAEKMDNLLTGLLRLSRLGRAAVTIENLDMNALMSKIIDSLAFQIETAQAQVSCETLLPCRGDAVQVGQVFSNLIENALKYRDPERPLQIKISSAAYREGVHYCIQDSGIGIPLELQAQVWEIFKRLNPKEAPGEGLGLTVARRIIDRLRGAIWLESEPGVGSQFFVMLPAVKQ